MQTINISFSSESFLAAGAVAAEILVSVSLFPLLIANKIKQIIIPAVLENRIHTLFISSTCPPDEQFFWSDLVSVSPLYARRNQTRM